MLHRYRSMVWSIALCAAAVLCASTALASVQFNVGQIKLDEDPIPFIASSLHDASSSPSAGASVFGPSDNRAYRTGDTSSPLTGSFFGDVDQVLNQVTNIRGTLNGKTQMLLDDFDNGTNFKDFRLKIGEEAGAGKTGKLAFETAGAGQKQYTGGYIDYVLAVAVNGVDFVDVLSGAFFFKPQAENSLSELSPNRGTISQFTLWGYNYMHDSFAFDGVSADWATFLNSLGYAANVTRPDIDDNPENQTLGISLYVTSAEGHMPEPTALLIWGMLTMVGACISHRTR